MVKMFILRRELWIAVSGWLVGEKSRNLSSLDRRVPAQYLAQPALPHVSQWKYWDFYDHLGGFR